MRVKLKVSLKAVRDKCRSRINTCMFSPYLLNVIQIIFMLSVLTDDGFISVLEGDFIEVDDDGKVLGVS